MEPILRASYAVSKREFLIKLFRLETGYRVEASENNYPVVAFNVQIAFDTEDDFQHYATTNLHEELINFMKSVLDDKFAEGGFF